MKISLGRQPSPDGGVGLTHVVERLLALSLVAASCSPSASGPAQPAPGDPPARPVGPPVALAPPPVESPRPEPQPPREAPRVYGGADVDPSNDSVVGPPDVIPDCHARLETVGVEFRPAELPLRQQRGGAYTCGSEQAVVYLAGPTGARFSPTPVVDCGLALAMAKLERVVQEEAQSTLGARVRSMTQLGTYVCRKMAAFPTWVSEHSYGNAIDIATFRLEDGRAISVLRDFERNRQDPTTPAARFLREVARRSYDEGIFSVVLTPFYDELHRNHFHFDLARYRANETMPGPGVRSP